MTPQELEALLAEIADKANAAIDKLIPLRQASENGNKYKIGYIIKKFEVIAGACNRAQDKLPVEFKL
jgi:hypothetical protein